eukprot:403345717
MYSINQKHLKTSPSSENQVINSPRNLNFCIQKLFSTQYVKILILLLISTFQIECQAQSTGDMGFLKTFKNANPVVGVLTIPGKPEFMSYIGAQQFIFSMNERFFANASIDSVAIPYNINEKDLYDILDRINGVFFTGGSLDLFNETTDELHPYTITSQKIMTYALQKTDSGDYFPIVGICQGIELLHIIVANNTKALGWSKYENKDIYTEIEDPIDRKQSRFLNSLSEEVYQAIQGQDMLYHLHHRGIPSAFYKTFPQLNDFFNILTVNTFDGQEIVSTAEAWNYPVYVFQYHPEIVYEDDATDIQTDKSPHSYRYAQELARFLREEMLKSSHQFDSIEEIDRIRVKNGFKGKLGYIWEFAETYGFNY